MHCPLVAWLDNTISDVKQKTAEKQDVPVSANTRPCVSGIPNIWIWNSVGFFFATEEVWILSTHSSLEDFSLSVFSYLLDTSSYTTEVVTTKNPRHYKLLRKLLMPRHTVKATLHYYIASDNALYFISISSFTLHLQVNLLHAIENETACLSLRKDDWPHLDRPYFN